MISKPWPMSSHALLYLNQDEANTSAMDCIKLAQRLSIVVDVADALEYLHHNHQETIVHCYRKPSNIISGKKSIFDHPTIARV